MQCLPKQVSDVLPIVGRTILTFLHLLFSVFEILRKYFYLFTYKWSERIVGKHEKHSGDEVKVVTSAVKEFKQVPKHLVIILGTETITVSDVVNLVVWSLAAGIPYVSFHDYQGSLREHSYELDKALEKAVGRKVTCRTKNGYAIKRNGSSVNQVPCISILDSSDGKEFLVNIVRKLCAEAGKGPRYLEKLTQDELDQILIKESGLPEAQLAIYLGSICCMYGFMPWHARLTEFLPLPNSDNITVTDFLSVLRKYNKCELRFGK